MKKQNVFKEGFYFLPTLNVPVFKCVKPSPGRVNFEYIVK